MIRDSFTTPSRDHAKITQLRAKCLKAGLSVTKAALEAAKLRFRPILMTAFAFILGVLPLVMASGAMAEARKVMGLTVCVGMFVATVFGLGFIPALYVIVDRFERKAPDPEESEAGQAEGRH